MSDNKEEKHYLWIIKLEDRTLKPLTKLHMTVSLKRLSYLYPENFNF